MAEINVERKKQTPIWPWIIGILVLLGLIWFLVDAFNEDSEVEDEYQETEMEDGTSFMHENRSNVAYLTITDFLEPKQAA